MAHLISTKHYIHQLTLTGVLKTWKKSDYELINQARVYEDKTKSYWARLNYRIFPFNEFLYIWGLNSITIWNANKLRFEENLDFPGILDDYVKQNRFRIRSLIVDNESVYAFSQGGKLIILDRRLNRNVFSSLGSDFPVKVKMHKNDNPSNYSVSGVYDYKNVIFVSGGFDDFPPGGAEKDWIAFLSIFDKNQRKIIFTKETRHARIKGLVADDQYLYLLKFYEYGPGAYFGFLNLKCLEFVPTWHSFFDVFFFHIRIHENKVYLASKKKIYIIKTQTLLRLCKEERRTDNGLNRPISEKKLTCIFELAINDQSKDPTISDLVVDDQHILIESDREQVWVLDPESHQVVCKLE
ncbi:MAG: hypothetical protein ACFFE8_04795 [Candidatus Heimdallarchaeota archaeon]